MCSIAESCYTMLNSSSMKFNLSTACQRPQSELGAKLITFFFSAVNGLNCLGRFAIIER